MQALLKAAAIAFFVLASLSSVDRALAQCQGETLQAQEQSAPQPQQFELLSPDDTQSLVECAEWALGISAVYALARLTLRRPRVVMVLFPSGR